MEWFIVGMVVGYALFPIVIVANKIWTNAWKAYKEQ